MSEDREVAMQIAIKALLRAAKRQGIHVEALCDGAIEVLGRSSECEERRVLAATTIRRLSYGLFRST